MAVVPMVVLIEWTPGDSARSRHNIMGSRGFNE
jgi:hypothetical protein